jgi:hypothetical protein
LWRATVEDSVDKIRAWQQAVITTEVRPKIYDCAGEDKGERTRLLGLAKAGRWREDPWLSRQCRRAFTSKRPRLRRSGRIVADNCSYDVQRDEKGRVWLAVMTTTPRRRLRLNLGPLPEEMVPSSTIEIRPDRHGGWHVIAAYPASKVRCTRPCHTDRTQIDGIDAGVSEVFTDTTGRRYGAGQYTKIATRAERDRARGKARNKLRARTSWRSGHRACRPCQGPSDRASQPRPHQAVTSTCPRQGGHQICGLSSGAPPP